MSSLAKVTGCGLKSAGAEEYEILLEDLEFAFPKWQLVEITDEWNAGTGLELLAKRHRRDRDEIFLALFHQARKGLIERPIGRRLAGT